MTTLKINRHWYDEVRTFIKKKELHNGNSFSTQIKNKTNRVLKYLNTLIG